MLYRGKPIAKYIFKKMNVKKVFIFLLKARDRGKRIAKRKKKKKRQRAKGK